MSVQTNQTQPPPELPDAIDAQVLKVAGVVVLGAIMSILDITVVNVALPTFQVVFADGGAPISYAHASLRPGAQLEVPWPREFSGLVYVLGGRGFAGAERRPVDSHDLVVFGPGDVLTVEAADAQDERSPDLEVLLLGGLPIREPIAHYGPFLMNTKAQILEAIDDFNAGKMGTIPGS